MNDNSVTYDDGVFTGLPEYPNQVTFQDKYEKKLAKNGRILYFKNGVMTAKDKIPEGTIVSDRDMEVDNLAQTVAVPPPTNDTVSLPTNSKECFFGDGENEYQKYINGQVLRLCRTHYEMTTGNLVQAMREYYVLSDNPTTASPS